MYCGLVPSKFTVREIRILTNQTKTKLQYDTFADFATSVLGSEIVTLPKSNKTDGSSNLTMIN